MNRYLKIANLYYENKLFEKSITYYEIIADGGLQSSEVFIKLGLIYLNLKNQDKSEMYFTKAFNFEYQYSKDKNKLNVKTNNIDFSQISGFF